MNQDNNFQFLFFFYLDDTWINHFHQQESLLGFVTSVLQKLLKFLLFFYSLSSIQNKPNFSDFSTIFILILI